MLLVLPDVYVQDEPVAGGVHGHAGDLLTGQLVPGQHKHTDQSAVVTSVLKIKKMSKLSN